MKNIMPPTHKPYWMDLTSMTPLEKIAAWLASGHICAEHTNVTEPVEVGWTYKAKR